MIKLITLVEKANSRYDLNLTASVERDIVRKLRVRGFDPEISRQAANDAVDVIFDIINRQDSDTAQKFQAAYNLVGGPKLVVESSPKPCFRCKGPTRGAQLHTRETVEYCPKCKIALTIG